MGSIRNQYEQMPKALAKLEKMLDRISGGSPVDETGSNSLNSNLPMGDNNAQEGKSMSKGTSSEGYGLGRVAKSKMTNVTKAGEPIGAVSCYEHDGILEFDVSDVSKKSAKTESVLEINAIAAKKEQSVVERDWNEIKEWEVPSMPKWIEVKNELKSKMKPEEWKVFWQANGKKLKSFFEQFDKEYREFKRSWNRFVKEGSAFLETLPMELKSDWSHLSKHVKARQWFLAVDKFRRSFNHYKRQLEHLFKDLIRAVEPLKDHWVWKFVIVPILMIKAPLLLALIGR